MVLLNEWRWSGGGRKSMFLYPVFGWVVRVTQFGDGGVYLTCQKKLKIHDIKITSFKYKSINNMT